MKAYLTGIRFFAGDSPFAPQMGARNYETRFASGYLWAELTIDTAEAIPERALWEQLSCTIYRADGFKVKSSWKRVSGYRTMRGSILSIWLGKLGFPYYELSPNTYHIEIKYDGKVIGTAAFEVV